MDRPTRRAQHGGGARAAAVVLWLAAGLACQQPAAMLRVSEARQRMAELTTAFTRASDATNRAVMAVTDETSVRFATEANDAAATVQTQLDAATTLIRGLGYEPESHEIDEFAARFKAYRELQERILDLAVENTNIKAQHLAFGPAAAQADAVVATLEAVEARAPGDWQTRAEVRQVTAAIRTIQALQAPHIVEPEDASMASLEQRMTAAEAEAQKGLAALSKAVPAALRGQVAEATAGFTAFMQQHREVLALSRRNTNVRSLALALNDKGKLTLACEESLQAIRQGLDGRTSFGNR